MPLFIAGLGLAHLAVELWAVVELRRSQRILSSIDDRALNIGARLARMHAAAERRDALKPDGRVMVRKSVLDGREVHQSLRRLQRRSGLLFDQDAGS